jgi:hypothetical protein
MSTFNRAYSLGAAPNEPQRADERSAAKPQPNHAKRMECVQLAGAFGTAHQRLSA